jgi:hypothetical protein
MLRRVALVRTDVPEELSASFIRVTRIGELALFLGHRFFWPWWRRRNVPPKRRFLQESRRNIPEDTILHSHRRENLKS